MSREQRARLDAMLREPRDQPEPDSVEGMRAEFATMMARMAVPAGTTNTPTTLGGRPALRVERDSGTEPGTILYFHGGAYLVGSPTTALGLTANLVLRTGFTAFSVDYRLAPEHPFPAGIDDALAAYRALLDGGTDPATVAFAGDSAGGGVAVAAGLAARDAGLQLPAAILGFSPYLDLTHTGASTVTKAALDPVLSTETLDRADALYLAGADPAQPLVSPAVAADLTGFPPLLLQVGTNELLLDDATRLAERARAAEVDVVLDVTAGVPHVFQSSTAVLDEAVRALDRAGLFLVQHTGIS